MSDDRSGLPHFLRVARALARVRGAAVPLAAITTVIAGVHCGHRNGAIYQGGSTTGTGGETTMAGYGGEENGLVLPDGGYGGGPVGDVTMPGCYDGGGVGDMSMPACDGGA
jgi:hypothetical protein